MPRKKISASQTMTAKGRRKGDGKFIMIHHSMYKSPAMRSLSNVAFRLFAELKDRYNGQNNGDIGLSCRDAGKVAHCSPNTAKKALQELQDKGFIQMHTRGLFTYRTATTWILTCEMLDGAAASNEWK